MALKLTKVCCMAKVREKQNPESLFPGLSNKDIFAALDGGFIFFRLFTVTFRVGKI